MKIKVVAVGKLKENYLKQGISEYLKRLSRYCTIEIIEVRDEPTPDNASNKKIDQIKTIEGERILAKIKDSDTVYVLALDGEMLTSEALAERMNRAMVYGTQQIVFVIGGSLGTSQAVNQRADTKISFGKMTLPHQLMRLVLIEQIYRSFRIIKNEPYHK